MRFIRIFIFFSFFSQSCQCLKFLEASAVVLLHAYSVHNKSWRSLAGLGTAAVYHATKNLTPCCGERQQAGRLGLHLKMGIFSFLLYVAFHRQQCSKWIINGKMQTNIHYPYVTFVMTFQCLWACIVIAETFFFKTFHFALFLVTNKVHFILFIYSIVTGSILPLLFG